VSAAAADRDSKQKLGDVVSYKLPASGTIYKGTLVSIRVADGYAYAARNGTATDIFVGVAEEKKAGDGTAGSARIRVRKTGTFVFALSGAAQTDVGVAVYASDDQTLTKTSTNAQLVGYIVELVDTDLVRVRIDRGVQ
jgi:hypothetical protein